MAELQRHQPTPMASPLQVPSDVLQQGGCQEGPLCAAPQTQRLRLLGATVCMVMAFKVDVKGLHKTLKGSLGIYFNLTGRAQIVTIKGSAVRGAWSSTARLWTPGRRGVEGGAGSRAYRLLQNISTCQGTLKRTNDKQPSVENAVFKSGLQLKQCFHRLLWER